MDLSRRGGRIPNGASEKPPKRPQEALTRVNLRDARTHAAFTFGATLTHDGFRKPWGQKALTSQAENVNLSWGRLLLPPASARLPPASADFPPRCLLPPGSAELTPASAGAEMIAQASPEEKDLCGAGHILCKRARAPQQHRAAEAMAEISSKEVHGEVLDAIRRRAAGARRRRGRLPRWSWV